MSARSVAVCVALLALSQPALAREAQAKEPTSNCQDLHRGTLTGKPAGREALDASVVCLTVNTAFASPAPTMQRKLLAVLLLMSAQPARGHGQ